MWWTYVLVGIGCTIFGFLLAAMFAGRARDERQEEEDFYKAMRDLKEKKEKKENARSESKEHNS